MLHGEVIAGNRYSDKLSQMSGFVHHGYNQINKILTQYLFDTLPR